MAYVAYTRTRTHTHTHTTHAHTHFEIGVTVAATTTSAHQIGKERNLLGFLCVALKLVQTVLQLESQGVIVSPHNLQHLVAAQGKNKH